MAKIFLAPLRLMIGWGISPRLLGWVGITMLVLMRLVIGFHFFTEGSDKLRSGNWSAAPFFANAKGPFAEDFRAVVWDHDGSLRLDRDKMLLELAFYRDEAGRHYGFDEAQATQAQSNFKTVVERYDWVIESNADDIDEYGRGAERIAKLDGDPMRDGVDSLGGQRETIRKERNAKIAPVLKQIDTLWADYEATQNAVATADQSDGRPGFRMRRPPTGENGIDTSVMDEFVPYFDMIIGTCLLFGLFTSVASVAAAGFLFSVFLSQFPPAAGPSSTMYQLVECMACLVLAATGAGRFAGLDFFLHMIVRKTCGAPSGQE